MGGYNVSRFFSKNEACIIKHYWFSTTYKNSKWAFTPIYYLDKIKISWISYRKWKNVHNA